MDKDELVHLANGIYEQAFEANAYWDLMKQYEKNTTEFLDEVNASPAFYNVVYCSLRNSLFLFLSKIYDNSKNAISIKTILDSCEESISLFPKDFNEEHIIDGQKVLFESKYRLVIDESNECFFDDKVKQTLDGCESLGLDRKFTADLSIEEYILYFKKKLHSLNKINEKLRSQRNKYYVHNDKATNFKTEELFSKNPVTRDEIELLIDFAFEVSTFCIACLTGVGKPRDTLNKDDWYITLQYVKIGKMYQEEYLKKDL